MQTIVFQMMHTKEQAEDLLVPKGWKSIEEWENSFGVSPIGFWHEVPNKEDGNFIVRNINPNNDRMSLETICPIAVCAGDRFYQESIKMYTDPFDLNQAYMPIALYEEIMC